MITECPHCDSKVDCEEKGSVGIDPELTGAPAKVVLLECKVCKNPLFGWTEVVQTSHDDWDWDHVTRLWPEPDRDVDGEIPAIARISLIEAKTCFKAKAYSACAVMCGRTLEGVCKNHDSKTKSLASGLKKLREDGIIDNRLFDWGDALRKHRNLGAHATTERVTRNDARDLLDFCIAICEYVFVLNEKFNRFQERQNKDNSND